MFLRLRLLMLKICRCARLCRRKKKTDPRVDAYLEDRLIFEYFDGSSFVKRDPMMLWRLLRNHETFNMETTPPLVDICDDEATKVMVDAIREIFEIEKYQQIEPPIGLTELETLDIYSQLADWLDDLQKKTLPGATSSEPTGSESSILEEHLVEIMKPLLDSGSTATEPSGESHIEISEPSTQPPIPADLDPNGLKP